MTNIAAQLRTSADHHAELGMSDLIVKAREAAAKIEQLTRDLEIWKRNGGDILLRAEVEQLTAERDELGLRAMSGEGREEELRKERDHARAEVEQLRRANARTHALVRDVSAARDTAVSMKLERDTEITQLKAEMQKACNLLAERQHGSPTRSAGHNARLCLEAALEPKS